MTDFSHVTFISAGAGSGKTYRLTRDLEHALTEDGVDPARVMGTTFTVKAAGELKERVRERLIEAGRFQLAEQMAQALIGTVHSVCERLLGRFSFELGLSPDLNVMSLEDGNRFFNQALDDVLDLDRVREMNQLARRLGQERWQRTVMHVAIKVRENDVAVDDLPAMARDSADSLLAHFRDPEPGNHHGALAAAVAAARAEVDTDTDTTKKTREFLESLALGAHQLGREDWTWPKWIALCMVEAAKKSEPLAAAVRGAAARYELAPEFHAEMRAYIEGVFDIAGQALARFQTLKTERGLIDFLDMEQLTLRALDEPPVRERLGDELELLLVDEFQDTNPMQLALFVKLAGLADRVIFVGDVKQAIYAFRGCDPDLVFESLDGMARARAETDILPKSWRSRPSLVHYVNDVFARAFAADSIEPEHVVLEPEREEQTTGTAVERWTFDGDKGLRVEALAAGISQLVRSGYEIVDPESNTRRPVRWGDVAVLARTNDNVELIARTLKNQRVPMKMTLSGLLETPEVCLARACLRRLNDVTDTLATAEIVSLSESTEPEGWLTERLQFLDGGVEAFRWAEDSHPIIARLAALRDDSPLRSPVEIVARVLNDVGTRAIATAWGPDAIKAAQRQRNLDAFLDLAVAYERHCESHHDAATLTGYLFWLENPSSPELDLQPMITSGDAVHVLTYHRAKGLEWPVVITTDFHYNERPSVWDVRATATAFDVTEPLANRRIHFWPNVFGRRKRHLEALGRILGSPEGVACAQKSASEQRRLAYVGITRARDLLVMVLPEKNPGPDAWLHAFTTPETLPTGETLELESGVQIATRVVQGDEGAVAPEPAPFAPRWFEQRERAERVVREALSPSSAAPLDGAVIEDMVELGARIRLKGDDMAALGNALHAVIAAEIVNPDLPDAEARALAILDAHGVGTFIEAADAVAAARRLRHALQARHRDASLVAECPVVQVLDDGRVVRGFIDLLVRDAEGSSIIDHKSSPRARRDWPDEVVEYSGQLAAYAGALEAAGETVAGQHLHFPVTGGLVKVSLRP